MEPESAEESSECLSDDDYYADEAEHPGTDSIGSTNLHMSSFMWQNLGILRFM